MEAFTKKLLIGVGIVGGIAGLGAIALSIAKGTGEAITEEARFQIRDMFEVGPDCDWIHFKYEGQDVPGGETLSESDMRDLLTRADSYYFKPMVAAGKAAGITDAQAMAIFILEDMFPLCKGQFPPDSILDVSKQLIWFAVWSHVSSLM